MKCEEVRTILADAAEETAITLPPELASHLAACRDCGRLQSELAQTWKMLDSWCEVEPSADFRARFWRRVERRESRQSWAGWWESWAESLVPRRAAAALVLVLLIVAGAVLIIQRPVVAPPEISSVSVNSDLEDEQLLQSLHQLTKTAATNSLEMYDLWRVSGEESLSLPSPSPERPENKKPSTKPGGVSNESIG